MKVCDDGALALRNRDIFVACALDDGERNGFLRHFEDISTHILR